MQSSVDTWTMLGRADTIISFATFAASLYAAIKLWKHTRALRSIVSQTPTLADFQELIAKRKGITSPKPVAIAASLIPQQASIANDVKEFLLSENMRMPIEELNMDGINDSHDLEILVNKLRELRRKLDGDGYSEAHLFLSSPVQVGTIFGAAFDNWKSVKLYHKNNRSHRYEYWMPLVK